MINESINPGGNAKNKLISEPSQNLKKNFVNLTVKALSVVISAWIFLYLLSIFGPTLFGLKSYHIQLVNSLVTVSIAFAIITATRRLTKRFSKTHPQFSESISFFIIILVSLVTSLSLLYQSNVNPQEILIAGSVVSIIVGIGMSTIIGNIFSGGLMLTTYPVKIGESIFIVGDNIRGRIEEISMLYTKIQTDEGKQYIVPNNAIIQGSVRILHDTPLLEQLPYGEGDYIEAIGGEEKYVGTVIRITPKFTVILNDEKTKESILANVMILSGNFTIVRRRLNS